MNQFNLLFLRIVEQELDEAQWLKPLVIFSLCSLDCTLSIIPLPLPLSHITAALVLIYSLPLAPLPRAGRAPSWAALRPKGSCVTPGPPRPSGGPRSCGTTWSRRSWGPPPSGPAARGSWGDCRGGCPLLLLQRDGGVDMSCMFTCNIWNKHTHTRTHTHTHSHTWPNVDCTNSHKNIYRERESDILKQM